MPDILKQIAEKINNSSSVLVILPPMPSADSVAASLALSAYLKKMDKDVLVVATDGQLNPRVDFLPSYATIARELDVTKSFVIDVSTKRAGISELTYKKENDKLAIYLKAKNGELTADDVSFRATKFPHDLIITIGVGSLDSLGSFYGKFAEMFFETLIVNIDFRGSNEGYGQFNLVELNASSNSEIVYDLLIEMEKELVDSNVATSLLAGIIAETNSFQHTRTTPQAFLKASQLISLGGDQQEIVTKMYKNKSLGFLKLWGRVLARIVNEPEHLMVYSAANANDVEKSGAVDEDVKAILKEMLLQLSFAKIFIFFREVAEDQTEIYLAAPVVLNLPEVFAHFNPDSTQSHSLHFRMSMPLGQAEQIVLEAVRKEAGKLS